VNPVPQSAYTVEDAAGASFGSTIDGSSFSAY
jgi:hypothetical protein